MTVLTRARSIPKSGVNVNFMGREVRGLHGKLRTTQSSRFVGMVRRFEKLVALQDQIRCLFLNAIPDPVLRYFSKLSAFDLSRKAVYEISLVGRNLLVVGDLPS